MKVVLIVPTFNAEKTILNFYENAKKYFLPNDILFINDGSTDKTQNKIIENNLQFLTHKNNIGKGGALKTGFQFGIKNNYDFALTMDVDLQHSFNDIPKFLDFIKNNNFDLIIGNRFNDIKKMPIHRKISNLTTSFLAKVKTGVQYLDSQCGFRLYKIEMLKNIPNLSNDFVFESEIIFWAAKNKYKITSIPVETIYNDEKSSMKHFSTTINFIKALIRKY